jgi:hypothetical protein
MLEVPAVEELARRGPTDHLEALREHARACRQAAEDGDMTVFLEADRDFHLSMLGMLGNRRLVQLVEMLRDQTRLYGLHTLAAEGRLVSTAQEHFDLLDAVLSGNPATAGRQMIRHLQHVRGDWAAGADALPPASGEFPPVPNGTGGSVQRGATTSSSSGSAGWGARPPRTWRPAGRGSSASSGSAPRTTTDPAAAGPGSSGSPTSRTRPTSRCCAPRSCGTGCAATRAPT